MSKHTLHDSLVCYLTFVFSTFALLMLVVDTDYI